MTDVTYTPATYWHRLDDEILEPRQTVTVTVELPAVPTKDKARSDRYRTDPRYESSKRLPCAAIRPGSAERGQSSPNLDWRGVPFPEAQP